MKVGGAEETPGDDRIVVAVLSQRRESVIKSNSNLSFLHTFDSSPAKPTDHPRPTVASKPHM